MKTPLSTCWKSLTHSGALRIGACLLIAFSAGRLHAASNTWNGTTNSTWDTTTANWLSPPVWKTGDDATFGTGPTNKAISVSETQSVGNFTVSTAGYTFSGGTISTTNKTWTINSTTSISSNLTIDTTAGDWSKAGSGSLTLSGNVTQTGANRLSINAGKIIFTGNSTLAGALKFLNTAEFDSGTHTMASFSGGSSASFIVAGANVTSTGSATVGNGNAATLTVNSGSLTVNGSINVGSGAAAGTVNLNGGVLAATQLYASANSSYTQKLIIKGGTFKALANQSTDLFVFTTGIPPSAPAEPRSTRTASTSRKPRRSCRTAPKPAA